MTVNTYDPRRLDAKPPLVTRVRADLSFDAQTPWSHVLEHLREYADGVLLDQLSLRVPTT